MRREPANPFQPDPTSLLREQAVQATVAFSVLMYARLVGDFDEAADARKDLERLGVRVGFRGSRIRRSRTPTDPTCSRCRAPIRPPSVGGFGNGQVYCERCALYRDLRRGAGDRP